MQIAQEPSERCERMTLPFDELWLAPAKAGLTPRTTRTGTLGKVTK